MTGMSNEDSEIRSPNSETGKRSKRLYVYRRWFGFTRSRRRFLISRTVPAGNDGPEERA